MFQISALVILGLTCLLLAGFIRHLQGQLDAQYQRNVEIFRRLRETEVNLLDLALQTTRAFDLCHAHIKILQEKEGAHS